MDIEQAVRELRELYPSIPISWFMQLLRRVGLENFERLRGELAEAERQTLRWLERRQKKEARRAATAMQQLRRLEVHRALRLDMPLPVPRVNVKLVLAYGFAKVGSRDIFAGRHTLKTDSVLQNIARKLEQLGIPFIDRGALRDVLGFLAGQGVVQSNPGKQGALSLNLNENAAGVSETGRLIIVEAKRFFRDRYRR
ncbi:MAG: hypothetical protein Q8R35_03215 [bacterium]|nr:hypothetical protein [bacterium]